MDEPTYSGQSRDTEEALAEISVLLDHMLTLATLSASGADVDRTALQAELSALRTRIDQIADSIDWSGETQLFPAPDEGTTNRWV